MTMTHHMTHRMSRGDLLISLQVMFTDIVLGIADPNVFIPPAACSPAQAAATDPASSFRLPRLFNR